MRPRQAEVASLAVVALLVFYLWLVHGSLSELLLALGFGKVLLHDYCYFFYPMGEGLLREPKPVEGFLHSPFAALFFCRLGGAARPVASRRMSFTKSTARSAGTAPLAVIGGVVAIKNTSVTQSPSRYALGVSLTTRRSPLSSASACSGIEA